MTEGMKYRVAMAWTDFWNLAQKCDGDLVEKYKPRRNATFREIDSRIMLLLKAQAKRERECQEMSGSEKDTSAPPCTPWPGNSP